MFLRANTRKKDGKEHRYWSLVETARPVQPIAMIWLSVSHARANTPSDTCFQGCGLAARTRQSNDFG